MREREPAAGYVYTFEAPGPQCRRIPRYSVLGCNCQNIPLPRPSHPISSPLALAQRAALVATRTPDGMPSARRRIGVSDQSRQLPP